jgi:DNA-directed RNA polymerase beta subunit
MNKDKNELLNELKQELIQKKKNELTGLMNTRLKSFHEITQEIVKYELEELNKDLDEYIKILEIKINAINEQSQINAIIININ